MRLSILARRSLIVIAALVTAGSAMVLSVAAHAEQWTAAQKEVLEAERACVHSNTVEAFMPCFHEDFEGWGLGVPVPTNTADRRDFLTRVWAKEEWTTTFFKPLAVNVYGDTATVLYVITFVVKNKSTGKEKTSTEQWLDVLQKRGKKWAWITDYGTLLSSEED